MSQVRILIAEDHALVRRGTAALLSLEPDMKVVGEARDGIDAVALAMSLRPDIVLMDLAMPRLDGVAATREITRVLPDTHVLALTTFDDDERVFAAVSAGARGYLLKDVTERELLDTIRALRRGESRISPYIARKMMEQWTLPAAESLNDKEEQILRLISQGMSNRQIAAAMSLAEGTVKNYVSRIMEKLHANSRTKLAVIAARRRRTPAAD